MEGALHDRCTHPNCAGAEYVPLHLSVRPCTGSSLRGGCAIRKRTSSMCRCDEGTNFSSRTALLLGKNDHAFYGLSISNRSVMFTIDEQRHSASSLPHHSTARTRNGNDSTTSVKKLISIILHSNSNDSDKRATKRKGKERTGNCSGDVDALVKSILANFSRKDYFTSSSELSVIPLFCIRCTYHDSTLAQQRIGWQ